MKLKNYNLKIIIKALTAFLVCALVVVLCVTNSAFISNLFKQSDTVDGTDNGTIQTPDTDEVENDVRFLSSTIESNAGVSAGGSGTALGQSLAYNDIDSGKFHTLVADKDGFVYARGSNEHGQLGVGSTDYTNYISYLQPVLALADYNITKVAAGGYHSIAIGQHYKTGVWAVFTWGRQEGGRLGNGASADSPVNSPINITANFSFQTNEYPIDVSAGEHHSMLLTSANRVFTFGNNTYGQIGNNTRINQLTPTAIGSFSVKAISAGSVHSLALGTDSKIYAWGSNRFKQCSKDSRTEVTNSPYKISDTLFAQISAGELHNAAITSGGDLYLWGDARGGKLSDGFTGNNPSAKTIDNRKCVDTGVTMAAAGGADTIILKGNQVKVTGYGVNPVYGVTANGQFQNVSSLNNINYIDNGGLGLFVRTNGIAEVRGYAIKYSEGKYEGINSSAVGGNFPDDDTSDGISWPIYDTSNPGAASYLISNGSADYLRYLTPKNNIIGLPQDSLSSYRRSDLSGVATRNGVSITTDRVKLTTFHTNGQLAVKQVTKEKYDTNSFADLAFTNITGKSAIINREGYYVARFYVNSTVTYKKFIITNKTGPEITVDDNGNASKYFAAISFYDGFGIKSVSVNGTAVYYGGTTGSFSDSASFGAGIYDSVFNITENSASTFEITVTDNDGKSTTINHKINTVVSLITKDLPNEVYNGVTHPVAPLFYTPAKGEFDLARFNSEYTAYTVTPVQYTGGNGYNSETAPKDASGNNYTAGFSVSDSSNTNIDTHSVAIKIAKTTPQITAQSDKIFYGQELSLANLRGTALNPYNNDLSLANGSLSGIFKWPDTVSATNPEVSASGSYVVTFYPTDTTNYDAVSTNVTLTVNKTTPTLNEITSNAITYEQSLDDAILSYSVINPYDIALSVEGNIIWDRDNFAAGFNFNMPSVAESGSYPVKFTPTDTNNYLVTPENECILTVNKKSQTVTFIDLLRDNSNLAAESIAKDKADYEISINNRAITVTSYTTAIYPSSAPIPITFSVDNSDLATVTSQSTVFELIDGVKYSKTTATLSINSSNQYGIVRISANQSDNPNYLNAETKSWNLYIKKVHNAQGFTDLTKTYGDSDFTITPGLTSNLSDFTLVSQNNDIVTVSGSGFARTGSVLNAGTATLKLSHPGYINPNDPTDAYVSLNTTVSVTVNPAILNIGVQNVTAIYGDAPSFTYTYLGIKNQDDPSVVIRNLTLDYDLSTMKDVGSYTVTPYGAENVSYNNYTFNYSSGQLSVSQRTVTATIEDCEMVYGEEVPDVQIRYSNFAYSESVSSDGITAPTVDFNGIVKFSPVNNYLITLVGGNALNYRFDITDTAHITVTPAEAIINLDSLSASYDTTEHFNAATVSGLVGGTTPLIGSSITLYFAEGGSTYAIDKPVNAGIYNVKVVFTPVDGDNYKITERVFEEYVIIGTVNSTISLADIIADYTGYALTVAAQNAGLDGGTAPNGRLSYLFTQDGKNYSDFSAFEANAPIDAGVYSIKVKYTPGAKDNYSELEVLFIDVATINSVDAVISLDTKYTTYSSSNGITPDEVKANTAMVKGVGPDTAALNGTVSYSYFTENAYGEKLPFNAGTYKVKVTFTVEGNKNYKNTEKVFESGIIIYRADITDSLNLLTKETSYTGDAISPNAPSISGIAGGSEPLGTFVFAYRIGSAPFSSVPVRSANKYDIQVSYIPDANDNYTASPKVFSSALIINTVDPTIILNRAENINFTGRPFDVVAAVRGLPSGTAPTGTLSYLFRSNGNTFTSDKPLDAATYDVQVVYSAGANDNYSTTVVVFENIIKINAVSPTITIRAIRAPYTGNPVEAAPSLSGVASDMVGPQGTMHCKYRVSGGTSEWLDDAPVTSGYYDVMVNYTSPASETNYRDSGTTFLNSILILHIAPNITLVYKSVTYNGESVTANTPTFEGIENAFGSLRTEYRINGIWGAIAPVNAGSYAVRVIYRAATVDNFTSAQMIFDNALAIHPKQITVTPVEGQYKEYDGMPINGADIKFTFGDEPLIAGNTWSGTLRTNTQSSANSYVITRGNLSAGANYEIDFVSGVEYVINKKVVGLSFPEIQSVYDGKPKQIKIEVDSSTLVTGETLTVETNYIGDNVNVGVFRVSAALYDRNYELPAVSERDYQITPATMTNNRFEDIVVRYNGRPHSLTLSAVEEGAKVTYDNNTTFISRGSYVINATVSKPNYYDEVLTATLTILKGIIGVTVSMPDVRIEYGDEFPTLITNSNLGIATVDNDQITKPGVGEYSWTFIPFDIENYEIETGTLLIPIYKSQSYIEINGSLDQVIGKPQNIVINAVSKGGSYLGRPIVIYIDSEGNELDSIPTTPGSYTVSATYIGNEYYEDVTYTATLKIKNSANLLWLWILLGAIAATTAASIAYFVYKRNRRED